MKKDGFTIVELIAVITILGLIIVLTIPAITNSNREAQKTIGDSEKRSLIEAGKMVGVDLDDYTSSIYNCHADFLTCERDSSEHWKSAKIDIADLRENDYFEDKSSHCTGEIVITKVSGDYDVTLEGVECTK